MFEHVSYHLSWAEKLYQEIQIDQSDWFHPRGAPGKPNTIGDFDYGRMRFVNRNLNYFYYDNMLSHALKNSYEYNPNYPITLQFCQEMRTILNENGPFGRMCIWKLVSGAYLRPHVDNFEYHRKIRRYIFCISEHSGSEATIKIQNKIIEVKQGLLFQFNPSTELHEFVNNTDKEWYFLGFDFWDIKKLNDSAISKSFTYNTEIEYEDRFGGHGSKTKYMSKE